MTLELQTLVKTLRDRAEDISHVEVDHGMAKEIYHWIRELYPYQTPLMTMVPEGRIGFLVYAVPVVLRRDDARGYVIHGKEK